MTEARVLWIVVRTPSRIRSLRLGFVGFIGSFGSVGRQSRLLKALLTQGSLQQFEDAHNTSSAVRIPWHRGQRAVLSKRRKVKGKEPSDQLFATSQGL